MSLTESIARPAISRWRSWSILRCCANAATASRSLSKKTGQSPKYFKYIFFLLDQGGENLIEGVQRGIIPQTTALEIARANENATEGDGQSNHHAPHSNLTEMYPGIYRPGSDSTREGPNLPTGPMNTLLGFELETCQIPLDQLLPSKKVPDGVMSTHTYKQIVSSNNEVGLIELLFVIQSDRKNVRVPGAGPPPALTGSERAGHERWPLTVCTGRRGLFLQSSCQ